MGWHASDTHELVFDGCRVPEDHLLGVRGEGFRTFLRILDEGIAQRAGDIDVVWCSGYGFPRYRGGPMFYADTIGLQVLLAGMEKYRTMFGPMHWEPAPLLVKLVREGRTLAQWSEERSAEKQK